MTGCRGFFKFGGVKRSESGGALSPLGPSPLPDLQSQNQHGGEKERKNHESINSTNTNSFVFLAAFGLACVGLTPSTHALLPPPPPDGGYPGGNTAEGQNALFSRTTGNSNTALGFQALKNDTTGGSNTAAGNNALFHNSVGGSNTAVGVSAAFNNIAGVFNTAVGNNALFHAISGIDNTAVGVSAAFSGDGDWNTAVGMQALYINNASGNSALGFQAMFHNTTGSNDVAVGYQSLSSNTTGSANTAVGDQALSHNTTGIHNTACGASALNHITTGGFNIALGQFAGANLTTGSNNIEIGHAGFAGDHDTIRIGGSNGIGTFIDGIYGVSQVGPSLAVYVSSGGQLVTSSSSRRFKKEIKPMDEVSEAILALKPVTFHYKTDKTNTPQFGLIAEEVAAVNPDLVVLDKEGKPYSVRYDQVNAMLLNEFLKEHHIVQEQQATITRLESTVAQQKKEFQATVAQLTTRLDQQAAQIQKVSAQLEASKPAPQVVNNP